MEMQHVENLLRRYKNQLIDVKTISGGVYEGKIVEITNDYVALEPKADGDLREQVFVLLRSIEAVLPRESP